MRKKMSVKKLNDDVKAVEEFCFLENALNARGGSKITVVTRTRIGWIRCRECGEVLRGRRFSVKDKKGLREGISDMRKIGNIIRKRNMVFERKRFGIIKKN